VLHVSTVVQVGQQSHREVYLLLFTTTQYTNYDLAAFEFRTCFAANHATHIDLQMSRIFYHVKIKRTLMVQKLKYAKFNRRENNAGYSSCTLGNHQTAL